MSLVAYFSNKMYIFCHKVRFFNELLMAKNEGILTVVSLNFTTRHRHINACKIKIIVNLPFTFLTNLVKCCINLCRNIFSCINGIQGGLLVSRKQYHTTVSALIALCPSDLSLQTKEACGGVVVERQTQNREVLSSNPTSVTVLCP